MILRSGSTVPPTVVCDQLWTITVSARWRIWAMIQSPHCCAPGVPGMRVPNASWAWTYPYAACALNGVWGVTAPPWQPASE